MSKQSTAKEQQGYVAKAVPLTCSNCHYFRCDRVNINAGTEYREFFEDKNLRCALGGFAVKKMGACKMFSAKSESGSDAT